MEQKTAETLELNQKILESSPFGIITYNSSGQCVFANDTSANIAGGTKEQLLQQNFNYLESWKKSGLLDLAKQVLATGIIGRHQVHAHSAFGKELWLDCRFSRFTSGGEPHLLLVHDDVAERKRAEETRKQFEKEMARLDRLHLVGEMAAGGIGQRSGSPVDGAGLSTVASG